MQLATQPILRKMFHIFEDFYVYAKFCLDKAKLCHFYVSFYIKFYFNFYINLYQWLLALSVRNFNNKSVSVENIKMIEYVGMEE